MKKLSLFVLISLGFVACKSGNEELLKKGMNKKAVTSVIQAIKADDNKATIFEVETDKISILDIKNGGKIEIPANAFVDLEGNPITGKVKIEWQEFHSLAEITMSGIPMKYDSAGVQQDFISGGMFTMKASQDEKQLELAPNKKAKIDLASIEDTPCFNFYKLDEEKGDWAYKTTKTGTSMTPKSENKSTDKASPKVDNFKLIDVDVNTSQFQELQNQTIVAWKTTDKIGNINVNKIANSTKLLPGNKSGNYVLEVNSGGKTININVQPYTFEEAKKDSKKNKAALDQDFAEERKFQEDVMTGKILRSIEIESLGTFNWDAILHIPNHTDLFASIKFPDNIKNQSVKLFFICPELNATIKVNTAEEKPSIKFDPTKDFKLIGLLTDNSIVTVDKDQLSKMKGSKSKSIVPLRFTKTGKKVKSIKDLEKIIEEQV
jgi:hypothetical protein